MLKRVLLVAGILVAGSGSATEIPLKNAGFEQAMVGKRIPGWSRTQHAGVRAYDVISDSDDFADGKHSIRMQRTAQQVWGMIMQRVESKDLAGKPIEISARLKTEDVGKLGWVMVMTFRNHQNILDQIRAEPLTGNTKWTEVVLKGIAPANTNAIDIGFMLLDEGTGWIDDVRLRLLDEESKDQAGSRTSKSKMPKDKS
jgi:hypothetical protein